MAGRTPTAVTTSSASTWPPPARSSPPGRTASTAVATRRSTPASAYQRAVWAPSRGADRRGQRRGPGLHHGDLAAVRGRRGGQFGADPAGPHDGQPQCFPALAGLEQVAQRQRVVVGAQEALPPVAGQRHRQRPGRQHQVVEGVRAAAGDQLVAEPGGGLVRPEVHLERGEVGLQRRVEIGFGQELLGQRRPVVGRPRFGPDQRDRAARNRAPAVPPPSGTRPGPRRPPLPARSRS